MCKACKSRQHFQESLRQALLRNGYCDFGDDIDDGRRSIYNKNGYLETRANAKEAWKWLYEIGALRRQA